QERLRAIGQTTEPPAYWRRRATPGDGDSEYSARGPEVVSWDEGALARFPRAVVLADRGFGNTWLLRYEARRLAIEALRQVTDRQCALEHLVLPIHLPLSEINQSNTSVAKALVKHTATVGRDSSRPRSKRFCAFVAGQLQAERCAVLMDAWDEVP